MLRVVQKNKHAKHARASAATSLRRVALLAGMVAQGSEVVVAAGQGSEVVVAAQGS